MNAKAHLYRQDKAALLLACSDSSTSRSVKTM